VKPQERIIPILEELGGTYIKLGQLLSIRPDLIELEYCEECQKLQDDVKPFSFEEAKKIIEAEFKKPLDQVYSSFNKVPIAAASIGQVHEAKLKDGERVAVKVQRPNIRQIMNADIDVMEYFAARMENHARFKKYRPKLIVEEFKRYTENELDYIQEARNCEQFYENFRNSRKIKIPKVYWDYTTDKVLTLEFIDGAKIRDLVKAKHRFDKKKIINCGLDAEFKQIFEDGIFHADLHPGNMLLLKDGRIAFLDFGIVGVIKPRTQRYAVELFLALMDKDASNVADILLEIGSAGAGCNREKFRREVELTINKWYGRNLRQERVTHMLHKLFNICADNDIRLPIDLVLLGKALVTIEGTCQMLDPEFEISSHARPYLKRIMEQQSEMQIKQLGYYYTKLRRTVLRLPDKFEEIIENLKEPKVRVDIEDADVKRLGLEIDKSSNRLSYGILISALMITGALMSQMSALPKWWGIPFVSVIFFGVALLLGVILLYSVLNEGR
jgi:ubiquinone biosynthesis protein